MAPEPIDGVEYEGLLTADYSQIEMRIMVHLAADEKLIAAYEAGEDLHRYVGSEVFGVAPEDVTPEQRSKVKAMSYGLAYGLSRFGLAKQLNISSDEAGELRTNYFKRFGRVGRFLRGVLKQAHQDGYTETIFGRRRVLPDLDSPNRVRREAAERAALNAPIQGTAADIIKIAMINIHRRLREEGLKTRMLLQVHDEIILEVATGEREAAERVLVEEMSGAASLRVPLDVQVGWGKSWQEAGPLGSLSPRGLGSARKAVFVLVPTGRGGWVRYTLPPLLQGNPPSRALRSLLASLRRAPERVP